MIMIVIIIWQGGPGRDRSVFTTDQVFIQQNPSPPPPLTVTITAEKLCNDPDNKKLLKNNNNLILNNESWRRTRYIWMSYTFKASQTLRHTQRHTVVSVKDYFNDP